MQRYILTEGHSGYIIKEELESLLRKTFGILDFRVKKIDRVVEMTWEYFAPEPLTDDEIETITDKN